MSILYFLASLEPIEIRQMYSLVVPMDRGMCQQKDSRKDLKASFMKELLNAIHDTDEYGCFSKGPCKLSRFSLTRCNFRRNPRQAQATAGILFELLSRRWKGRFIFYTAREVSETVDFYLKRAVNSGQFSLSVSEKLLKPVAGTLNSISMSFECTDGYEGLNSGVCGKYIK